MLNLHAHRNGKWALRSCDPHELETLPLTPNQWFSVGLHPWWLDFATLEDKWSKVNALTERKGLLAIGEVGLDRRSPLPVQDQIQVLKWHIQLASTLKIPLILHVVDYLDDLLKLRKQYPEGKWIWHGFHGHETLYQQLVDTNTDFSIGKKIFSGSLTLEKLVSQMPEKRLWIESDQEDDLVLRNIYQKVAKLRNIETDILIQHIFVRFQEDFKIK